LGALLLAALPAAALMAGPALAQQMLAAVDVQRLSIEQLANVEITSVSKAAQPLSRAAASAFVITQDDIARSGAMSLPDMLRMAPNLEVMQTSPSAWNITARGFNGNRTAQNFPNKLLVLIDGRSVYTPLYSGVYWDMPDVLPENVERIEVISGPGGTLWGANAVNGVINVITRKSADTQGGLATFGVGTGYASAALQYGGMLDDDLHYRLYARDFYQRAFNNAAGANAQDSWTRPQGGFQLDWTPGRDALSLHGDIYGGSEDVSGTPANQQITGANLTLNWTHPLEDGSALQLLTYFDQTRRAMVDGGAFTLNSYDIELQHNFALGDWNSIVWGVGQRFHQYRITSRIAPESSLIFSPPARVLSLTNIFAEDHVALSDAVQLTIGVKLENDPYSGLAPMPSGRLSWQVTPDHMVWASASRAVRSPTPFDTDVVEKLGALTYVVGNRNFLPETVDDFEIGYRGQITHDTSLSVTLFDSFYDDLRTIEITPATFIPLTWGNAMRGDVHGVEIWGSWQASDWWRLSAGFTAQHMDLEFKPGASRILGRAQVGDDPHHWASLRSSMRLADDLNLEADLRYVGELPDPKVPDYAELNARLAWQMTEKLELSVAGFNLLHGQHLEYPGSDLIRRSVYLQTRVRF
jgi:iron complex outermembrane receptor protein